MSKMKKTHRIKSMSSRKHHKLLDELDFKKESTSESKTEKINQISEMIEDVHDIIENSAHYAVDYVKTMTDSFNLIADLISKMLSGASECAGEVINRNTATVGEYMKCSNALDMLNYHHNLLDNNYGLCNKYGISCGDHLNSFTNGASDIMKYNLTNNWLEKFKNKKRVK
jgi:hypothetical protein